MRRSSSRENPSRPRGVGRADQAVLINRRCPRESFVRFFGPPRGFSAGRARGAWCGLGADGRGPRYSVGNAGRAGVGERNGARSSLNRSRHRAVISAAQMSSLPTWKRRSPTDWRPVRSGAMLLLIKACRKQWSWPRLISSPCFFLAQFVNFFAWSKVGVILAVNGAACLKALPLGPLPLSPGPVPLLVGLVLLTALTDIFRGSTSAKRAILAPVFVPMFMRPGQSPEPPRPLTASVMAGRTS